MASIIRIKRSTGTSAPGSLKSGELAYSYGTGSQADNGDRLFFGSGDDGSGNATSVVVAGGKYFTDLLDHVHGTLTASSAIIVDANKKIDELNVDNITINGNTISTTNANGSLVLDPNGQGHIDVSGAVVKNAGTPSISTDLATKGYVDQVSGAALLTMAGDTGNDTTNLADSSITFTGGTGLSTVVTDGRVTTKIDSTGVVAGTYGSATAIPVFTVNEQGQLVDSVSTVSISSSFTLSDGSNTDVFNNGETLTFTGTAPITTAVSNNQVTIAANNATTSTKGVASFTSDDFTVTTGSVAIKAGGVANTQLENNSITINSTTIALGDSATLDTDDIGEGSTNLYYTDARARAAVSHVDNGGDGSFTYNESSGVFTYTGPSASETRAHFSAGTGVSIVNGEVSIGQAVDSTSDVQFNNINTHGNVTIQGNLDVQGTTTTINTVTTTVTDPLIHLADSNDTTDAVDIGFIGHYYSVDNSRIEHTGFFRDATNGDFYLFTGLSDSQLDASNTNVINRDGTGYTNADLHVGTLTADNINGTSFSGSYAGFDSDVSTLTTDDIAEGGTNQYYKTSYLDSDLASILQEGTGIGITNGSGTYTINADIATTSAVGVASFNTSNFTVSGAGAVTTKDITVTTGDTNTKTFTAGSSINLNGNATAGITTSTLTGDLTISAVAAANNQRGTASFDSVNFSVLSGHVSVVNIDGGTY